MRLLKMSKQFGKNLNKDKRRLPKVDVLLLRKLLKKKMNFSRKRLKKQEEYTKTILNHGLCQSANEIDNMLLSYKTKTDKTDTLTAQLKFRKYVPLQQAEEKQTFNITKKGEDSSSRINLTVELTLNLKKLVKQAIVTCMNNSLVKQSIY